ncbi:hypothetical protein BDV41DRAFT_570023 [Aspergillus transmontanensis]|uniref:C2H2-type domain-containing protein n=1 Tax=Aspergillus transmontanensis TaxID=1034304 RepID=A0A5N6VDT7_9EURO|nr:hypothetical protein BDV41DRAFT_570023 [Aspergillus transmontanensis]
MNMFLEEKIHLDHVEYLQGVSKYCVIEYLRRLLAERKYNLGQDKALQKLKQRLRELQSDGDCKGGNNNADIAGDKNIEFTIKLTKKQLQIQRTRLYNTELEKYRDEWIHNRLEAVFYRPGEESINKRCPVEGCDLDHFKRADRSNYASDCKDTQLKYCYECHCKNHLQRNISRRYKIIMYCYILVRPGYCPFCLGCDRLSPSQRMNAWKRSKELRAHVNEDIKRMRDNYICSHSMCNVKFDSKMYLRYHLSDIHGMNKVIWTHVNDLGTPRKNKDLNNQVTSPADADKRKGQDPPNHRVLFYNDSNPAGNSFISLSVNPKDLTDRNLIELCTAGSILSTTSDESSVANKEPGLVLRASR